MKGKTICVLCKILRFTWSNKRIYESNRSRRQIKLVHQFTYVKDNFGNACMYVYVHIMYTPIVAKMGQLPRLSFNFSVLELNL